jgi:hypothetical protein
LIAGLLLVRAEPGDVFAAFGLVSLINAALVWRTGFDDGSTHERPGTTARAILAGSFGGFRYVALDGRVLSIVAVLAGVTVMFGALDVLFVVVAIGHFGESESWAGYLNASVGFGAIVGAIAAVVLVGRRRLTPAFAISASAKGIAIATLAAVPTIGVAAGVLAIAGVASIVNNVAGRTLPIRSAAIMRTPPVSPSRSTRESCPTSSPARVIVSPAGVASSHKAAASIPRETRRRWVVIGRSFDGRGERKGHPHNARNPPACPQSFPPAHEKQKPATWRKDRTAGIADADRRQP